MKITPEVVSHIARLCRISLSDEEHKLFTEQLNQILAYMDKLNKLNTENVEPTSHVIHLENVLREDKTVTSLPPEKTLGNAPDKHNGYFKVPKIIE
jgi:aspartyl-tRNA(Asn)/glutamyl-tRNA(Gln) amidotransferase subunit C